MVLHRLTGYLGVRLTFGQLLSLFLQYEAQHSISRAVTEILTATGVTLEQFLESDEYEDHRVEFGFDLRETEFQGLHVNRLTHDVTDQEVLPRHFILGYELFTMDLTQIPPLFTYTALSAGKGLEALKEQLRQELAAFPGLRLIPLETVQVQDDCSCCS
jgi:hypothetical protein